MAGVSPGKREVAMSYPIRMDIVAGHYYGLVFLHDDEFRRVARFTCLQPWLVTMLGSPRHMLGVIQLLLRESFA
jgi:hypothetical protein